MSRHPPHLRLVASRFPEDERALWDRVAAADPDGADRRAQRDIWLLALSGCAAFWSLTAWGIWTLWPWRS